MDARAISTAGRDWPTVKSEKEEDRYILDLFYFLICLFYIY